MKARVTRYFVLTCLAALVCPLPSGAQNSPQNVSSIAADECAERAVPRPVATHGARDGGFQYTSVCVRPYKPDEQYAKNQTPGGETPDGLSLRNWDPASFVNVAYGLGVGKLFGAPEWLTGHNPYDLEAKMDPATADALEKLSPGERKTARQHMLQALLADEFKLQVHSETRTIPAYNLVIAEGGIKFHAAAADPKHPDGVCTVVEGGANAFFDCNPGRSENVRALAEGFTGHPVIDKTGLGGFYTFSLQFRTTPEAWVKTHPETAKDTLPVTLADQLGLKLEPATISTEVIVIDHIEKPAKN
jgi:uncharacterized protein (TIGR03435 family)